MTANQRVFDRRGLLIAMFLLLSAGFLATSLIGYQVSRTAIRAAIIDQELPLTSNNIYAEIQKDLVRPVLISSTMANDTFLRKWVMEGERDPEQMAHYLREVKKRYGAFSSFFVSEKSAVYYTADGVLKRVSPDEPRDVWYYRVRSMKEDYEINLDPDLANKDALTIFINYRVFDFAGKYIGATGIGLTVDAVRQLIDDYQTRYRRTIYFTDAQGRVAMYGKRAQQPAEPAGHPGIAPLLQRILKERGGSYQYQSAGDGHFLNVAYLPDLKWYLFVEQNESVALASIRQTLYTNLAISLAITLIVVFLGHRAITRYQHRIEDMAVTDKLTGLFNRQAFGILMDKLLAEYRRQQRPFAVLLADIDHFKAVNDHFGHRAGDRVLEDVARQLRAGLRESDIAVRWGGEEFLLVLKACDIDEAGRIAEKLRHAIAAVPFTIAGETVHVTLSVGIAAYDGEESADRLIDRADRCLYRAKAEGRNRICAIPPSDQPDA